MLAKEQDLIYMSPMLSGFALKDKVWRRSHESSICALLIPGLVRFYIDDIRPVSWNDEAYDHLVYPEEQKDLVLTFVRNHQQMKAGLNDVIVGKGMHVVSVFAVREV